MFVYITDIVLQGAVALFDMIEFYQSATRLNISYNRNVGPRGWQAFARMLKKVRPEPNSAHSVQWFNNNNNNNIYFFYSAIPTALLLMALYSIIIIIIKITEMKNLDNKLIFKVFMLSYLYIAFKMASNRHLISELGAHVISFWWLQ